MALAVDYRQYGSQRMWTVPMLCLRVGAAGLLVDWFSAVWIKPGRNGQWRMEAQVWLAQSTR